MLVPVVAVTSVQVSVMQVVDVITVGDRRVSAVRAVFVLVFGVSDTQVGRTLVPVVVVLVMAVTVVDVVDMISVDDRHMPAVGTVHVRMDVVAMIVVTFGSVHASSLAFV